MTDINPKKVRNTTDTTTVCISVCMPVCVFLCVCMSMQVSACVIDQSHIIGWLEYTFTEETAFVVGSVTRRVSNDNSIQGGTSLYTQNRKYGQWAGHSDQQVEAEGHEGFY